MSRPVLALLTLLTACGGESSSTGTTSGQQAASPAAPSAPSSLNTQRSVLQNLPAGADPWLAIPKALAMLQDGAVADQISERLENRKRARDVEETQVKRALVSATGSLAEGCKGERVSRAITVLQVTETASLEKDREALTDILTVAGAQGRKDLWDSGEVGVTLLASRSKMATDLATSLPSRITSAADDSDTEARRILVSLKFAIEAVDLDTQAVISAAKNDIDQMDPASDDTVVAIGASLKQVDDALLAAQHTKYDKLLEVCGMVEADAWLTMLESGSISTYLGRLGGQSGIQAAVVAQSAGQQGRQMGQQGGGMMGQQGGQGGQSGGMMGQQGGQGGQSGGMMGQQGGQGGQGGGMMGQQGGQGGQGGGMMGQQGGQGGGMMGQQGGGGR